MKTTEIEFSIFRETHTKKFQGVSVECRRTILFLVCGCYKIIIIATGVSFVL